MIPSRYAPALSGLILSGLMSFVVSGISTFRAAGWGPGFMGLWTGAWLTAWVLAFPIVLVVAPVARRFAQRLVAQEGSAGREPPTRRA
jgi:membrane protein implicated in regulation of membrane protease activity